MKAEVLFRKTIDHQHETPKKYKNVRYSADQFTSSQTKASEDVIPNKKTTNNPFHQNSRKDSCKKLKSKNVAITAKQSMKSTKNSSPIKHSLMNSQLKIIKTNPIKNYKFYYQIGFGAFGKVWKVADTFTKKEYALKEISKLKVIQKCNVASIMNEKVVLTKLNHPFLINIHKAFQDGQNLYLLMDYLRGADLRYHICYKQQFSEAEIRFIVACLLLALQNIHSKNIIHRDIKPENIVFEEDGYVRITDFGISKLQQESLRSNIGTESSGTPVYMAPQILFKSNFSFESDYYALGIVIFELTMGRRPYHGKTRVQIREELMGKQICLGQFQLPKGINPQLANLINQLLKKNPSQRLGKGGVKQIKQHSFFKQMKWKKLSRKELKPPFIPNIVCQTQEYLKEISLFNQMEEQKKENENSQPLSQHINKQFQDYIYERGLNIQKTCFKKGKRKSQDKIRKSQGNIIF